MPNYASVLSAASQLSVGDRLRLIDEPASSVPDDQPPQLSDAWLSEIDQRSGEIDSSAVATEAWADVRARLFTQHGVDGANYFHPKATVELEASANWYAEHSDHAARDFCVAIDVAITNNGTHMACRNRTLVAAYSNAGAQRRS